MQKPAPVKHDVHDLIRNRWSPRAFADRPVANTDVLRLLEAARWAPSSYNEQPWAFIVAHRSDADAYGRMLSTLVEFNQQWAGKAPVLMIAASRETFEKNDKPNPHFRHDTGAALAWMTVQAETMGLRVHQMAGFDADKAQQYLGIPRGWVATTAVAIGYPGDPETLEGKMLEQEMGERSRKPMRAIAFDGRWEMALRGA